jgi:DNA primase
VRQDRRIDGQPFILKDKRAVKARTIGSPLWPIGVPTDKPVLTITEGSSDFLAAYSLICAEGVEKYVAPVAILGAANIIHDEALEYFRGKYVLMFPDYDRAGISAATRWSKQLKPIATEIKSFSFDGLVRDDGQKIKDLRDFLRVDVDQWEGDADVRSPLANFVSNLVSKGSINEPKEIK